MKNLLTLLVSGILLSLLLSACSLDFLGLGGSSSATATPKAQASPAPSLTTYKGNGYTIDYPQGWKVQTSSNQVQFTDTTGALSLIVEAVPNPNGIVPTTTIVQGSLKGFKGSAKNYKDESIASTTTINGVTWDQAAASGDVTDNGQTANVKLVVAATNHPAHDPASKTFAIIYAAPSIAFDLSNSAYFQPMVKSFKFSS